MHFFYFLDQCFQTTSYFKILNHIFYNVHLDFVNVLIGARLIIFLIVSFQQLGFTMSTF
jgi:hypothetical protein